LCPECSSPISAASSSPTTPVTTERLALQAGLAALTVCRFEAGAVRPRAGTAIALRKTLERLEERQLQAEAC
jgi:predicted transcriptional regulator